MHGINPNKVNDNILSRMNLEREKNYAEIVTDIKAILSSDQEQKIPAIRRNNKVNAQ